jgi:Uma2 family endonuclease
MSTRAILTTADELLKLPTGEGKRYELIEGDLRVMCAAGFEHGRVAATANWLLTTHARAIGTGLTLGAETGFILASDPRHGARAGRSVRVTGTRGSCRDSAWLLA